MTHDQDHSSESPLWRGVGMARPITAHVATLGVMSVGVSPRHHHQGDDILLLKTKRLASLADIGLVIVLTAVAELQFQVAVAASLWSTPVKKNVAMGFSTVFDEMMRWMLVPSLEYRALAACGLILLILYWRAQSVRSVGIGLAGWWQNVLLGIAATAAIYAVMFAVGLLITMAYPNILNENLENVEQLQAAIPKLHPLGFGVLAVIIGFYEELVFRGFLMTRLRRTTGSWTAAVVLSVIIFTVPHSLDQNWTALPAVAMLGVVVSLLTIWRRSIIPAVVAHALFNFSQFLLMYYSYGDAW